MTKKISFLMIALVAIVVLRGDIFARLTGTQPTSADIWCSGPSGAEVCVDASGNVVPTTTNDASSGSSSLRWSNVYSTLGNFSSTVTGLLFSGSGASLTNIPTGALDDGAVTSNKLASGAVATSAKLASNSIAEAAIIDGVVSSPKLASTAVTSGKVAGMNSGTASSGKVACWKDNGYGGYCAQLSSINSTVCNLCY